MDPELYEIVKKHISFLMEKQGDDDKSLTHILLLVSTGAFGLSINFFLNKCQTINWVILLKVSWVFLAVSIITNSCGYYLSRKENGKRVDFLNSKVKSSDIFTKNEFNENEDSNRKSLPNKIINLLNVISFTTFVVGIISLTIFAILQV